MAYLEHKSERKCSPAAPLGVDDQWWGGRAAGGPRSQRGTVVSHELAVVAELLSGRCETACESDTNTDQRAVHEKS